MIETANTLRKIGNECERSDKVAEILEGEAAVIKVEMLVAKKRYATEKCQGKRQEEEGDVKLGPFWCSPYKCVDQKIPSPA